MSSVVPAGIFNTRLLVLVVVAFVALAAAKAAAKALNRPDWIFV